MATSQPDAIALLKADHRKVEDLFSKFKATSQNDRKEKLARQICMELIIHTMIEEEVFYPACRGEVDKDMLDEAYVEHDGAKVLIAEIEAGGPTGEFYDAKVSVLSEMIRHHVKEEEKRSEGLFAKARAANLDVEALGAAMKARKQELTAAFEEQGLPVPSTHSFVGQGVAQTAVAG